MQVPVHVFIASAPTDHIFRTRLVGHFHGLEQAGIIQVWHDGLVQLSEDAGTVENRALEEAQIALLLISPDFNLSNHLWSAVLPALLEKEKQGNIKLAVVMVKPSLIAQTPYEHLPVLPGPGMTAITEYGQEDKAWLEVVRHVCEMAGLPYSIPKTKKEKQWSGSYRLTMALLGLLVLSFLGWNWWKMNHLPTPVQEVTTPEHITSFCGFPNQFVQDTLFILITRFEDYANNQLTECYGRGIESRIDELKNKYSLPVKICYSDEVALNNSDEARKVRRTSHADIVIWGKLKNADANCRAEGICMNFLPSDTLMQYAGGEITKKVDNEYVAAEIDSLSQFGSKKVTRLNAGVTAEDLEKGLISLGKEPFDAWFFSMVNLKIGKKKPDFYFISPDLPRSKQADEYKIKGDLYVALGNFKEAINAYNKSIELGGSKTAYLLKRAHAFSYAGMSDSCTADYAKVLLIDSINIEALVNTGVEYLQKRKYELAQKLFSRAIAADSNFSIAYSNRGVAWAALGNLVKAYADFTRVTKLEPTIGAGFQGRALICSSRGQYPAALEEINKAISLEPENALYISNRADIEKSLKQYDAALRHLDDGIQRFPAFPSLYYQRAQCYTELNKDNETLADLNKAIALDSTVGAYYSMRSILYFIKKRYEEAKSDCLKSIELDPNDLGSYNIMASINLKLEEVEVAVQNAGKAIQIMPKHPYAYYIRACAKAKLEKFEEALSDFNQSIKLDPKDANKFLLRGNVHYKRQRLGDALSDYSRAIQLNDTYGDAYINKATVLFKQGHWIESIPYRLKGVRYLYFPGNRIYFALGGALLIFFIYRFYRKVILQKMTPLWENFFARKK